MRKEAGNRTECVYDDYSTHRERSSKIRLKKEEVGSPGRSSFPCQQAQLLNPREWGPLEGFKRGSDVLGWHFKKSVCSHVRGWIC